MDNVAVGPVISLLLRCSVFSLVLHGRNGNVQSLVPKERHPSNISMFSFVYCGYASKGFLLVCKASLVSCGRCCLLSCSAELLLRRSRLELLM